MTDKIITIPNLISLLRLLLGIPLCIAIINDQYSQIILLTALVLISDYADGYLSRLLDQRSTIGQVIDPVVDFILLLLIGLMLVIKSLLPLWYWLAIILRYMIIAPILYQYKQRTLQIPSSIFSGKVSICFVTLTIVSCYFQASYPTTHQIFMAVSIQLMIASTLDYCRTYIKTKA